MKIATDSRGNIAVVSIDGDIDASTGPQVSDQLQQAIGQGYTALVIDLGGVGFMSSAGLRLILDAHQSLSRSNGRVLLAAANAGVYRVLETAGFRKVLACCATVEAAMLSAGNE